MLSFIEKLFSIEAWRSDNFRDNTRKMSRIVMFAIMAVVLYYLFNSMNVGGLVDMFAFVMPGRDPCKGIKTSSYKELDIIDLGGQSKLYGMMRQIVPICLGAMISGVYTTVVASRWDDLNSALPADDSFYGKATDVMRVFSRPLLSPGTFLGAIVKKIFGIQNSANWLNGILFAAILYYFGSDYLYATGKFVATCDVER